MTRFKKLKKAIRTRSRKTRESYTAARRQVLQARAARKRPPLPAALSPARGGISNASALKRTGRDLDHWFAVLDAFEAPVKGHTAAARHLREQHGVPAWHAQGITVAYERARGLRALNQASSGGFQVSVSKAVPASAEEVAEAIRDARRREGWLRGADPGLARALNAALTGPSRRRLSIKGARSASLRYSWEGTSVEIRVTGRPGRGASVVADNTRLAGPEQVERRRAQWRAALESLKAKLGR